ncbi:MAG: D-aminoacylase [Bacteroidia bacterium]|nr:D-aminoacylase [Bacteroidia bacterium]
MRYLLLVLIGSLFSCQSQQEYDIVILNGMVYVGDGEKGSITDIGIVGDEIIELGDLKSARSKKIIDANGMVVSPGFIDLHAHLDPILELSECESHIRQGVTTALGGPDGRSPWPFGAYLDTLKEIGIGLNVGYLTGHNQLRKNVMQLENRDPTNEELEEMKRQVEVAMEEGAFGISTGLKYLPGTFSKVEEVIALSRVAAEKGGFYTSHLREEGLGLLEGVQEAIVISEQAEIPVVLTHHKVVGKPMWGSSEQTLFLVDSARKVGLDIMIDQYPYTASHTGISILIPNWAQAGGRKEFAKRIESPVLRDSIKKQILFNIINDRGGADLKRIQFSRVSWKPELEGKTMYDWCIMEGIEPSLENGADMVIKAQLNGGTGTIYHAMDEADVVRIMQYPYTMVASDGRLSEPGRGHPHPRAYGTFSRILDKYVREDKVLSLEEAIRKMTSLPAFRMGLSDRGLLKKGYKADISIFDPAKVKEMATFSEPHQYSSGIPWVIINGEVAVDNEKFMGIKAGQVLYGPAKKP